MALIGDDAAEAVRLGARLLSLGDTAIADSALLLVAADRFSAAMRGPIPVVVVDAPEDPRARAALLDAGAADLVPAGIDPIELAARCRAILRRDGPIRCGDLTVDLRRHRADRGGRAITLHPREFAVLAHLACHRDRTVTRASLYAAVWQRAFDPGSNVVAVSVSRLRAKLVLKGRPPLVHTVPGGYMLAAVADG